MTSKQLLIDAAEICGFKFHEGKRGTSPHKYYLHSEKRNIWLPFMTLTDMDFYLSRKLKTLIRTI